jgi:hypothetical protein
LDHLRVDADPGEIPDFRKKMRFFDEKSMNFSEKNHQKMRKKSCFFRCFLMFFLEKDNPQTVG